jgi:hypothetical protein
MRRLLGVVQGDIGPIRLRAGWSACGHPAELEGALAAPALADAYHQ